MSYCRWSSDRNQCDLYCYEDVNGGWTTHVAKKRHKPIPEHITDPIEWICSKAGGGDYTSDDRAEYASIYRIWNKAMEAAPLHVLKSPHAGKTYNDDSLEAFRERIVELSRDSDLNVPTWLLAMIDSEIAEEAA